MRLKTPRAFMRTSVVLALATAASLTAIAPASADDGSTAVTFKITGGGLSVSQSASISLGTASTSRGATLGNVTVTDQRAVNLGTYTAQVVGSDFTTGSGTSIYTIPAGNVSYAAPVIIGGSGTAVRAPGIPGPIAESRAAMTATGVIGSNTSVWNPTITVAWPSDAVAGSYTGTITHSVA